MSQQISLEVIMFTILLLYVYSFTAKVYSLYFLNYLILATIDILPLVICKVHFLYINILLNI